MRLMRVSLVSNTIAQCNPKSWRGRFSVAKQHKQHAISIEEGKRAFQKNLNYFPVCKAEIDSEMKWHNGCNRCEKTRIKKILFHSTFLTVSCMDAFFIQTGGRRSSEGREGKHARFLCGPQELDLDPDPLLQQLTGIRIHSAWSTGRRKQCYQMNKIASVHR